MLPNNFEEWCEEVINQVNQKYDLCLSFDDIDEGTLEDLNQIYNTEIDVPNTGGKELSMALDNATETAITLLVENEGEDRELLEIDNHIARMIAKED